MKPQYLIVHHSYSLWGSRDVIDQWHKSKGWKMVGYHKVICNGYPTYAHWSQHKYLKSWDGKIQQGRPDNMVGAHCRDNHMNFKSLGICLIGNFDSEKPTDAQLASLVDSLARLCMRHKLSPERIFFHNSFSATSCPGRWFTGTYQPYNLFKLRRRVDCRILEYQNSKEADS